MRDLVDHHAREMMLDLTGERRPVPEMGRAGPAEPAGAPSAGPASPVHAGAGAAAHGAANGREMLSVHQTAEPGPYYAIVPLDGQMREINLPLEACLSVVNHAHAALWDEAVALAAKAGPMPLASDVPWAEGDEAYVERLDGQFNRHHASTHPSGMTGVLNDAGRRLGLPRARLVRGPDRIAELDRVEITVDVLVNADEISAWLFKAGSTGTVVAIYGGGAAYEVEFWNGVDECGYSLATVSAENLRLVSVEG